MPAAYIVSAVRTPVGRAPRGILRTTRPDDLAALALRAALVRAGVDDATVDDVILGCAIPEAEQGLNLARIAALRAGLPVRTSAATVNRFCASGIEAIAIASQRLQAGGADAILAGGVESMSQVPMSGHNPRPNPWLLDHHPETYLSMGLTAERLATVYRIGREDADRFALASHTRALAAQRSGAFDAELAPVDTRVPDPSSPDGWQPVRVVADEGPRPDTSLTALAALKPSFRDDGVVTAGNASQMSDGAAAALIVSESFLRRFGLTPLARLAAYATVGVEPELMGIGPVSAIPVALRQAGLELRDLDLIELNEAFAVQALAVIAEARLDPGRVNIHGGAIALGHPLGCTGARLLATLVHALQRRQARWGMITLCVGGGQGVAAIVENLRR